jgi:hypothetical protein
MSNLGWLALGLDNVKFITSIQDIRRDHVSNRLKIKRDTQNFFCIVIVRSA